MRTFVGSKGVCTARSVQRWCWPVEGIENLREKSDRMILRDAVPQGLGEQKNLIPGQGGLVPSAYAGSAQPGLSYC